MGVVYWRDDFGVDVVSSSFFFFSSRRRHTRFDCDWSSDVCSSDLTSSSVFVTTAESPSKFVPYSSALGKTDSAAASTAGSIRLPCRSTELSRKELGDAPVAIVVHPEPVKDRGLVFVGRHLWALKENRTAGC